MSKLNIKEDLCKIKKMEKLHKKEKQRIIYKKKRYNLNIPKVISSYKNPKKEMIPLEVRNKYDLKNKSVIDVQKLIEFNKKLDKIEEICKKKYKNFK